MLRSAVRPEREQYRHFTVDLAFTVTREGSVTDVIIAEANDAPRDAQYRLIDSLKSTHYRLRLELGEPVDTPGMMLCQGVYVAN